MATNKFLWRTAPVGVEGVDTCYVDSSVGSDLYGDGTRANPYQSLGKAYRGMTTKPKLIICRGRFSEMLADGNHACEIRGDYYGAAVFDGVDYYLIYGFRHSNMIIINTGVGTYDLAVHSGSGALAGVGGAHAAGYVGNAYDVYGVAGSPNLLDRTSLYYGVIGGNTAVKYLGVSRAKHNGTYRISLGGYNSGVVLSHSTVYGTPVEDRRKKLTANNYKINIVSTIFADFAMIANDVAVTYTGCLFAADSLWYYFAGTEGIEDVYVLPIVGDTSEERQASLLAALASKYEELGIAEENRVYPTFVDCLFSNQISKELFNDAENCDFTLPAGSDAIINEATYYGAFPPAIRVPIMTNSEGVPGTWDERTAGGCIMVVDDAICVDETSNSLQGEILSKIVKINPSTVQINGIYSLLFRKFTDYHLVANKKPYIGASYSAGDIPPIGRYIVKGAVIYEDVNIGNNGIVVVSAENTTFANDNYQSVLVGIDDVNIQDVIYVRSRATIYCYISSRDGLQRGATYLNSGESNISYRGRTIVPGESFVAHNNEDTFVGPSDDYKIAVMFDDTRVPSTDWIPAQTYGEYFVCRETGTIKLDDEGVPVSSGNPLAWQKTSNGGYSDVLKKSIVNKQYVQFAIFITGYDHITD